MTTIDHKTEAQQLLESVADAVTVASGLDNIPVATLELFNANASRSLLLAQVHATLYLAEQQRVSNLIAYLALPAEAHETESEAWPIINEALDFETGVG